MELRYKLEHSIQLDLRHLNKEMFPTSDMSIADIRGLTLLNTIFKKFEDESNKRADKKAVNTFLMMNERCRDFTFNIQSDFDAMVLGEVQQTFWRIFSELSLDNMLPTIDEILNEGGLGPGANIGAKCYNFYTKLYDSDLSHTSEVLLRRYKDWCDRSIPSVRNAEITRHENRGDCKVEGNNLTTVPKNVDVSRTICTEPTLNMYYQKGIGARLEMVLRNRFFIDLTTQPDINRRMAKMGSIDGNFCTIDLRSASDTIANKMVELISPTRFYNLLQLARSPEVKIKGVYHKLEMLSSMGNGFTFPFQTMLFATIVQAVYKLLDQPCWGVNGERQYSVFGDDIVVTKRCYHAVLRALDLFGFIVNTDKSFSTGTFRESCGHDYWSGHYIRGYYCKSLKTQANINSTYNGLYLWQVNSGIILENTNRLLREYCKTLVPLYENPEAGFYTINPPKTYFALTRKARSFRVHKLPYRQLVNNDGLLRSFVGGYITRGTVSLRSENPSYRLVRRSYNGGDLYAPSVEYIHSEYLSLKNLKIVLHPGRLHLQLDPSNVSLFGPLIEK